MIDHWATSDVLFLFIEISSLKNFSDDVHIRQYWIINQNPMSFCPYLDEIVEDFLSWSSDFPMLDGFPASDFFFVFVEIRLFQNFTDDERIF